MIQGFRNDFRMISGPPGIKLHRNFRGDPMVQNNCGGFTVQPRIGGGWRGGFIIWNYGLYFPTKAA